MLGSSVEVLTGDRPAPGSGGPNENPSDQFIKWLDERARDPHPMSKPNARFQVHLVVDGKRRQATFKDNDMYVPVRDGEVYEIWVENHTDQTVMMRLLVDGLNTLPQRVEDAKGIATYEIAPRVHLDDARPWVLDPEKTRLWAIRGFVTETGAQGKLNEFKVTAADRSLAARQQFTDNIGIITAVFYSAGNARTGPLGTTFGAERTEDLTERVGKRVGGLLSVINLRYVDAETLEAR